MTKWTLVTESGLVEKRVTPVNGTMTVGRESACDLSIRKNEISRKHAQLSVKDNDLFVEDLGSANGTTVNGAQISTKTPLKLGDTVIFETVEFTVSEAQTVGKASVAVGSPGSQTAVVQSINIAGGSAASTQMQLSVGTTFLTVVRGNASTDRVNLDNMHTLKIGRSNKCDLVLTDPTVSGEHAELTLESYGWQITNISQTNGLFIKGNKIIKHVLQDGDVIELGAAVLKFDTSDESGAGGGDRKIPDWMRDQH